MSNFLRMLLPGLSMLYIQGSAAEIPAPDPAWNVARAQFTSAIENREPVDQVVVMSPPSNKVYFFTDLRQMDGREIQHRWSYRGRVVSMKPFEVKGARWRVYSMNLLEPDQTGEWSVTVYDESGWPLHTELFLYEPVKSDSPGLHADPITDPSE